MMIWYDDSRKCLAWSTGNVVRGTQEFFCVEHRKGFVWNTGNVLLGAQECLACNKGNLVFAIEETYDDSS